jgi:LytS/YehU family sensor histidine kinase
MNVICVIFVVHLYETVFLIKETESEKLKAERLERSKVQAELEALKNQIDPHFVFNSLNTLSHLIETHPVRARLFNDHLADVYRYLLQNKGKQLVLLREEITFLENYFSLLKIRFESALKLQLEIDPVELESFLIPPISLQLLLENVIKHNEFSEDEPLTISVVMDGMRIGLRNEIRRKKFAETLFQNWARESCRTLPTDHGPGYRGIG